MILARKGRLGVSLMLDLALRVEPQKPVSLNELASRQELSAKYIEQLLAPLKAAGLVKTVRGARGGYLLGRPPSDITMLQIVRALEGPMPSYPDPAGPVDRLWKYLGEQIDGVLDYSLSALMKTPGHGLAA